MPTLKKIAITNLVGDPVFFFPVFYSLKEAMNRSLHEVMAAPAKIVSSALSRYRQNYREDWRNTWSVWVPGHVVTYGVCPPHMRMPWVAFVSFGYLCLLSFTRGDMQPLRQPAAAVE